jgi:hypothetical protein
LDLNNFCPSSIAIRFSLMTHGGQVGRDVGFPALFQLALSSADDDWLRCLSGNQAEKSVFPILVRDVFAVLIVSFQGCGLWVVARVMDGYAYDTTKDSVNSGESFIDDCETFLENYSRGDIDVGGPEPPELAKATVPPEVLSSGDLYAPNPPDDDERARELYSPSSLPLHSNCVDTNFEF